MSSVKTRMLPNPSWWAYVSSSGSAAMCNAVKSRDRGCRGRGAHDLTRQAHFREEGLTAMNGENEERVRPGQGIT
jgi:hypothetical protein